MSNPQLLNHEEFFPAELPPAEAWPAQTPAADMSTPDWVHEPTEVRPRTPNTGPQTTLPKRIPGNQLPRVAIAAEAGEDSWPDWSYLQDSPRPGTLSEAYKLTDAYMSESLGEDERPWWTDPGRNQLPGTLGSVAVGKYRNVSPNDPARPVGYVGGHRVNNGRHRK